MIRSSIYTATTTREGAKTRVALHGLARPRRDRHLGYNEGTERYTAAAHQTDKKEIGEERGRDELVMMILPAAACPRGILRSTQLLSSSRVVVVVVYSNFASCSSQGGASSAARRRNFVTFAPQPVLSRLFRKRAAQ